MLNWRNRVLEIFFVQHCSILLSSPKIRSGSLENSETDQKSDNHKANRMGRVGYFHGIGQVLLSK